ncbi:pickpocket protein 28 [Sitodiplosis mosellana]|uniref:pickpocket protein 28 n=1 Tax=Sitodiplosis mosellana TaxID=263140 RepID=UPI0024445722|nr:pickpocket protein 28 [Sitodiplosis mosellana]
MFAQYTTVNFHQYLLNTTLHGLKYVGDRTITRFERIFFTLMFLLVVILSVVFITNVYRKWDESPIIITLNSETTSITQIPFPAVTICNMNQVRLSAIRDIPKDSNEFATVKSLCRIGRDQLMNETFSKGSWALYRNIIKKVSPRCEDMLLYCAFGGVEHECSRIFLTILTDDGLCCVFNSQKKNYLMRESIRKNGFVFDGSEYDVLPNYDYVDDTPIWTAEKGYELEEMKELPRPGIGSGNELGLSLSLNADIDDYYCTATRSYGFKILLSSPNDLTKVSDYGFAIPTNYETRIAVKPKQFTASPAIRNIAQNIRQCVFESESNLTLYKYYSDRSCEGECESKLLYKHCGCIMYYQPVHQPNISICGTADMKCMEKVDSNIRRQSAGYKCTHCLPGCFALNYDSTYSTARIFHQTPFLRAKKIDPADIAIVYIYYPQTMFRTQKMDELVSFTDFLSNIGGLLGLFMGFSVISFIEMFYFISIRPYLQTNYNFDDNHHQRYLD